MVALRPLSHLALLLLLLLNLRLEAVLHHRKKPELELGHNLRRELADLPVVPKFRADGVSACDGWSNNGGNKWGNVLVMAFRLNDMLLGLDVLEDEAAGEDPGGLPHVFAAVKRADDDHSTAGE